MEGSENGEKPRDGSRVPVKVGSRNRLAGAACGHCRTLSVNSVLSFVTVPPAQGSTRVGTFIGTSLGPGAGRKVDWVLLAPPCTQDGVTALTAVTCLATSGLPLFGQSINISRNTNITGGVSAPPTLLPREFAPTPTSALAFVISP